MSSTARKVWSRRELEEAVLLDEPEGTSMFKVSISPKMLLYFIEYCSERKSESCEMVAAYGDPMNVELRFFYRDGAES